MKAHIDRCSGMQFSLICRSKVGSSGDESSLTKYVYPLSLRRSFWQDLSTARIRAQMNIKVALRSAAGERRSLQTYGKMPIERAKLTAHGPKSRKRVKRRSARRR